MSWWTSLRNTIEDIAPVAGAVVGGLLGGPAGAAAGGALGGAITGQATTHHLGGTLEGALLGGLGGYGGYNAVTGLSGAASNLSALAQGSASGSPTLDALGLMSSSPLPNAALGLGTATAPGYALPAVSGSSGGLLSDLMSSWGSSALGTAGNSLTGANALSGLAQLYQAGLSNKNAQQLQQLAQQSNAMGPYRAQYAAQLQQLMNNPSSIQNLPGYQAGIEAINRDAAAKGLFGSGNMASALGMYGDQLYQQQLQNLMQLSGSNINPAVAGTLLNSAGQSQAGGTGLALSGIQSLI